MGSRGSEGEKQSSVQNAELIVELGGWKRCMCVCVCEGVKFQPPESSEGLAAAAAAERFLAEVNSIVW